MQSLSSLNFSLHEYVHVLGRCTSKNVHVLGRCTFKNVHVLGRCTFKNDEENF